MFQATTLRELQALHPDITHMIADDHTMAILRWLGPNITADDFFDHGDFNMMTLAEHTIVQCPLLDADDESVWATDSGGVWDAAYIYTCWVESDEGDDGEES